MVKALERGLSLSDFEHLTVGFIVGYIATYNNLYDETEEEKADRAEREATQSDYDAF
jgi:hypothetical protein